MPLIKYSWVVGLMMGLSLYAYPKATFNVEVNRNQIDLSEYVEVKFIIEGGKPRSFNPGDLSAFNIVSGPNETSSMTYVNGKVSQSKIYSYYLKPKKEGTFKIAGASVMVGKQRYRARAVSVKVSKSKQTEQTDSLAKKKQGKFEDFVYIDIVLDKDTVYKGEQVIAKYNLYTLYQISNFNITQNPSLQGFWMRNLNDNHFPQKTQMINGKQYRVVELKRAAIFPQKSGDLELDPIEIEGYVKVKQSKRRSYDPFEDLFDDPFFSSPFSRYRKEKRKIASNTKTLVVKDLPLPEPDGFTGGVGKFTAGASVANRNLKTNESLSLNFTINGDGNIKLLDGPSLALPDGLEAYDTKVEENIYTNSGKVRGSKKFEYPIIPRHPGKYQIPEIDWWYFDVEQQTYKNYKLGPYTLNVEPGDDYADNQSTFDETAYQLKPIKTGKASIAKKRVMAFVSSPVAWTLAGFPILLLPLIGFVNKQRALNRPTEAEIQYSYAKKVAIERLAEAKALMNQSDDKPFYDEVIRSVWGYLQHKFGIENVDLDKPVIEQTLTQNNINEVTTNGINDLISMCEMALFAPSAGGFKKNEVYDKAVTHISQIEEQLS